VQNRDDISLIWIFSRFIKYKKGVSQAVTTSATASSWSDSGKLHTHGYTRKNKNEVVMKALNVELKV
jgi:hypothetical protein